MCHVDGQVATFYEVAKLNKKDAADDLFDITIWIGAAW